MAVWRQWVRALSWCPSAGWKMSQGNSIQTHKYNIKRPGTITSEDRFNYCPKVKPSKGYGALPSSPLDHRCQKGASRSQQWWRKQPLWSVQSHRKTGEKVCKARLTQMGHIFKNRSFGFQRSYVWEFGVSYLGRPPSRACEQDTKESNDHHITVLKKQQCPVKDTRQLLITPCTRQWLHEHRYGTNTH